jgi:uncharacterized membrane protein
MGTFIGLIFIALFAALFIYFYRRHKDEKTKALAGLINSCLILGTMFLILYNVMGIVNRDITFADTAVRFLFLIVLTGYVLWFIFIKGKDA